MTQSQILTKINISKIPNVCVISIVWTPFNETKIVVTPPIFSYKFKNKRRDNDKCDHRKGINRWIVHDSKILTITIQYD